LPFGQGIDVFLKNSLPFGQRANFSLQYLLALSQSADVTLEGARLIPESHLPLG